MIVFSAERPGKGKSGSVGTGRSRGQPQQQGPMVPQRGWQFSVPSGLAFFG
jgi:hypothetical protein